MPMSDCARQPNKFLSALVLESAIAHLCLGKQCDFSQLLLLTHSIYSLLPLRKARSHLSRLSAEAFENTPEQSSARTCADTQYRNAHPRVRTHTHTRKPLQLVFPSRRASGILRVVRALLPCWLLFCRNSAGSASLRVVPQLLASATCLPPMRNLPPLLELQSLNELGVARCPEIGHQGFSPSVGVLGHWARGCLSDRDVPRSEGFPNRNERLWP